MRVPHHVVQARGRPNLRLVHAAATSKDGEVRFTAGEATTAHHIVLKVQRSQTLTQSQTRILIATLTYP